MRRQDLHVHTTFCDGKNSPEEMVCAAVEQGLWRIGFSAHSHTFFDESYCLSPDRYDAYRAEIERLKEAYGGKIAILCGVEQDRYSTASTRGFDYVIGSVHYMKVQGNYLPVDESVQAFYDTCRTHFGGDFYSMAECYYETVSQVAEATKCDFIGHFDLITKFNEGGVFFDESHPRYVAAWESALDTLLDAKVPFEINTGAISRGYCTAPYPADWLLRAICKAGGRICFSSDCHSVDTLLFGYKDSVALAQACGFREAYVLTASGFRAVALSDF